MPTLMAAYGKQHEFADHDLKNLGLYGHFFAEPQPDGTTHLRLWHPLELVHMFGVDELVSVPKHHDIAWKQLGNAIARNHACFAIAMVLTFLLHQEVPVTTNMILNSLFDKHLRAEKAHRFETNNAWILAGPDVESAEIDRIRFFDSHIQLETGSIPAGTMLHQNLGVVAFDQIRAIWQAAGEIPPQVAITDTVKSWVKLQVAIAESHFQGANIRPDVLVDQIAGLWAWNSSSDLAELPSECTEDYHFQKLQLGKPTERSARNLVNPQDVTVLAYFDEQVWIARQHPAPAPDFFADISFTQGMHNGIGSIKPETVLNEDVVIYDSLPTVEKFPGNPFQMSILIPATNICTYADIEKDTIKITIDCSTVPASEDSNRSNRLIKEFWLHSLQTVWLQNHGRKAEFSMHESIITITLKPLNHIMPLPIPDLILVLKTHALRTFLHTIACHTATPSEGVKLKWKGNKVWNGKLPAFLPASWFRRVFDFFTKLVNDADGITMVSCSKQIGDACTLSVLKQRKVNPSDGKPILLAVAPIRTGGGRSNKHEMFIFVTS